MATATLQVDSALQQKVIDYLQDAHAMEANVLRMLDSMIRTTDDPETLQRLKQHRMDTERHEHMVRERLEQLGSGPCLTSDVPAIMGAWLKGLADTMRSDKPGKNARDGYVTEHVEIAAYSLLEQLAERAGDNETARVARFIREDEEEMARWIAARWGHFVDLTLEKDGFRRERVDGGGRGMAWAGGRVRSRFLPSSPMTAVLEAAGVAAVGYVLYCFLGGWGRGGSREGRTERWEGSTSRTTPGVGVGATDLPVTEGLRAESQPTI